MILISKSFEKDLLKIKSISINDVNIEIKKHNSWLKNLKIIKKSKIWITFKWYLLSKKVRVLIYFTCINNNYIPYYIVKKETKVWKNIRNEMLDSIESKLDKCIYDIENENFEIYKN